MSDLAIAAAAAGSEQPVPMEVAAEPQAALGSPKMAHENPYELPSVDDLEVAAAAAAAAMQAMQELQQDSEEEDSSSEDSDTDSDSDESDSGSAESDSAEQQTGQPLALQLTTNADGSINVALQVSRQQQQQQQQGDVVMVSRDHDSDSSSDDDDSSSSSSESSSDVESIDYNEMRDFIDKAYKVADEDDDAGPVPTLQEDLGLPGSVQPLTDIVVPENAELKQAGSIMSVLEGMVVVQGLANSRALDYGSVMLLFDKTPIGRVEEVFGPITHPLYALRYAGPQPPSGGLVADERVFYTDSLSSLVEDQVYTEAKTGKQKKAAVDYEADAEEDEPYFSDDEAEAEYRRSQGLTKRKTPAGSDSGAGHGRGRGRYGAGGGSSRGGRGSGPSLGFKAHATAGQLQGMALQQDAGARGGRGQRGGRGRGRHGGRGTADAGQQQQIQQQQQQIQQQQPGGWQNGTPSPYNGYPQQPYLPTQGMPQPGYGYAQMAVGGYMQQTMPPQGPVMMQGPAGGGYLQPGMPAGPPPHMMHMATMQQQYSMAPQQQQVAGGVPQQQVAYNGQPTGYGAQQWTGYGAQPPTGR